MSRLPVPAHRSPDASGPTRLVLSPLTRLPLMLLLLALLLLACPPLASGAAPPTGPSPTAAPPTAAVPAAAVSYRWPLDAPVEVVRPFEPPFQRWHPGHRGVDLAAWPDMIVRAAGPGVVRFAGPVVDRAVVSIDHPDRLRTTYEPVTPLVSAGDQVAAGDPIGVVVPGHSGCPRETCLHWGVRDGDLYLDPLALLGLGRVRLLPVLVSPAEG